MKRYQLVWVVFEMMCTSQEKTNVHKCVSSKDECPCIKRAPSHMVERANPRAPHTMQMAVSSLVLDTLMYDVQMNMSAEVILVIMSISLPYAGMKRKKQLESNITTNA